MSESYERFRSLMEREKINAHIVSKNTGIAYTVLADWKSGRSTPKVDKLLKIADYFGCSLDALIGR